MTWRLVSDFERSRLYPELLKAIEDAVTAEARMDKPDAKPAIWEWSPRHDAWIVISE